MSEMRGSTFSFPRIQIPSFRCYRLRHLSRQTDKKSTGFTLVELICILAVIFFLAALLMPALSRVRRISTRVVCSTGMKGFGTVGTLYLNDSDGRFPDPHQWLFSAASDSEAHPMGCRWHDRAMDPHGKIMQETPAFHGAMWELMYEISYSKLCPEFRDIAKKYGCENPHHPAGLDLVPQFNYTMNGYLGSTENGGVTHEAKIPKPATVFFFGEENAWSLRPEHPHFPVRWLRAPLSTTALNDTALLILPTPQAGDCFGTFHGDYKSSTGRGFGNLAFLDGHVSAISVQEQLRNTMHGGKSPLGPGGNLTYAWASETPPPGGWEGQ